MHTDHNEHSEKLAQKQSSHHADYSARKAAIPNPKIAKQDLGGAEASE
jgi:hypothetical protein